MTALTATELVDLTELRSLAATGAARVLRISAGLSLGEVAGAVGVSAACVFRWETGQRVPRGGAALRYADVLAALMHRSRKGR